MRRVGKAPNLSIWLCALVLACLPLTARAHDVPASTVLLDIGRTTVDVELQLPLSELGPALSLPPGSSPDQLMSRFGARVADYVLRHIRISTVDGKAYYPTIQSLTLRRTNNPNWLSNDWLDVRLRMQATAGTSTAVFVLDYDVIIASVVTHNAFVSVRHDFRNALFGDEPRMVGLLAYQQTHLRIDGSGGSWWQGFKAVFSLGAHHIAAGTDHLLFLLVLLLPAPLIARQARWREADSLGASGWRIIKTVSGFTLGHSLTLAAGALGLMTLPIQLVEVLIAVSIIVSVIHALRPLFSGKEPYLAAGFGLIHGMAFATTLSGLGYDAWTFGLSLFGFNLGIEAMQLLLIAVVLPSLLILSRTAAYVPIRWLGAFMAVLCALGWIAERAWQLQNPMSPILDLLPHASWGIALLASVAAFARALRIPRAIRPRGGDLRIAAARDQGGVIAGERRMRFCRSRARSISI